MSDWHGLAAKTGQATRRLAASVPRIVSATVLGPGTDGLTVALDTAPTVPAPARTIAGGLVAGTRVYALAYPPRGLLVLGASGGSACGPSMTKAQLIALRDSGGLDPCAKYVVTDWASGSLPGPNTLTMTALAPNKLSAVVGVTTPLDVPPYGPFGPDRGVYLIDFDLMIELSDPFGNRVNRLGGAATTGFPFGNFNYQNVWLNESQLTGAIGNSVVGMADVVILNSSIDFTGTTTSGFIFNSSVTNGTFIVGAHLIIANSQLQDVTITNTSTGIVQIQETMILGNASSLVFDGTAASSIEVGSCYLSGTGGVAMIDTTGTGADIVQITNCRLLQSTIIVSGPGTRQVLIHDCQLVDSNITYSRNLSVDVDVISAITLQNNCGLVLTGSADPGTQQIFQNCAISEESSIVLTDPAGAIPLQRTRVEVFSGLNVEAGGTVGACRISTGATVNTGAFTHRNVAIEFAGVTTLTANNTDTYKGFGASNVI